MAEEAIFSFVLDSLRQLVADEANFLVGVKDKVSDLEDQLKSMRWFLRDGAANQQERVREWVIKVRDLSYEAENVIETYAIKVKSRRGGGVTKKMKRFASILNECYLLHQIGSDVDSLLKRAERLAKSFSDYGIREIMEKKDGESSSSSSKPLMRRTYSFINPHTDVFVGLDNDIEILARSVVGEEYAAVCICGMGGIGKTTLARKVYHHPRVRKHFDTFVWVCISQQWKKEDVLHRILVSLLPNQRDTTEKWTDEEQVRELSSIMLTKKCIIVLDDVWTSDVWKTLEAALPIGNKGSKVLVTTRNNDVANCIGAPVYIHVPRLLDKMESWELLSTKVLQRRPGGLVTQDMEELGKVMVDHCGGLPLAVIVLGGILASKNSYEEWKVVHKSVKSYLSKGKNIGEDETDLLKILALSYNDLPHQLKPCFLYLSKYAEDEEIKLVPLYQHWMAEGMILSKDKINEDETMMDVAERYLGELAERCMVFVEMEEIPIIRRFKWCRLHDMMRELCISKSKEENLLELQVNSVNACNNTVGTSSRLFISFAKGERIVAPAKEVSRSLRSFGVEITSWEVYKGSGMLRFDDFVMLRILILDGLKYKGSGSSLVHHLKQSSSIGKLIHLRCLRLTDSSVMILSSAVSNLNRLETLDLRGLRMWWIFNVIWKLQSLKHLYLPLNLKFNIKMVKRGYDSFMLRLDGLNKLEILEGFDNEICHTKDLSTLINLRSLTAIIYCKEGRRGNNRLQEFINQVRTLHCLQFLALTILAYGEVITLPLLEEMFSLACLVEFQIDGKINALPEYRDGFGRNLSELKIFHCEMDTDPLSTLEKLPNLRTLELGGDWFGGVKMTFHAMGFPKLKSLFIGGAPNLKMWEIENGAMPHLSLLTIWKCPRLKMIPDGLRFVTSLKQLVIDDMPAEFLKRVTVNADGEEGQDFHKIRHIPNVQID